MQLSFKRSAEEAAAAPVLAPEDALVRLSDLDRGGSGVIARIELTGDLGMRLMELGFLPDATVSAARCAPGGDPRVYRIDGTEIALRRETASKILLHL
jgi:Fe2+ transport system protein FeoA